MKIALLAVPALLFMAEPASALQGGSKSGNTALDHKQRLAAGTDVCRTGCKSRFRICKSRCPRAFPKGKKKSCVKKCAAPFKVCLAKCK